MFFEEKRIYLVRIHNSPIKNLTFKFLSYETLFYHPQYFGGFLAIFIFLIGTVVFAQERDEYGCGTIVKEDAYLHDPFYGNSKALLDILRDVGYDMPEDYLDNLDTYGNYIGRDKTFANKAAAPTIREIPVKAWIWRNDNGSGNISLNEVENIIDILNNTYANNTNIRFYLLCDIGEINNSSYTNNGGSHFYDICSSHKTSGALNVHFIIDSNANWVGKANFPTEFPPIIRYSCVIETYGYTSTERGKVLSHEIGHTLGLYHTHHPGRSWSHTNNGGCGDCHQESVSRTRRQEIGCVSTYNKLKCDVNGDFLCDTAADPELRGLVNYLCVYDNSSGGTDNWGETWTPNTSNIMSYSQLGCLNYFSPLQVGKMNYYYTQIGISYPYYSLNGPNYVCKEQTVTFSVPILSGVTNYEWDTSTNLPITSGWGTNSITVTATDNYGGYVKVTPGFGYNSKSKTIKEFYDLEINGYDTACAQSGYTYNYSVPPLSGATYNWSFISNGTINSGNGTNTVNVSLTSHPTNQSMLSVAISGVCTSTVYKYKTITHGDPPPPEVQCITIPDPLLGSTDTLETILEEDVKLYPNPTTREVNIFWPSKKPYRITLRSTQGTVFYSKSNIMGNPFGLNVENYPSGIYFVYIEADQTTIIKKLILKK